LLNYDLWKELLAAAKPHQVTWKWEREHSGNRFNSRLNGLIRPAREKKQAADGQPVNKIEL
jgi:ribonuclease HI